jgi:hypothetical protein
MPSTKEVDVAAIIKVLHANVAGACPDRATGPRLPARAPSLPGRSDRALDAIITPEARDPALLASDAGPVLGKSQRSQDLLPLR